MAHVENLGKPGVALGNISYKLDVSSGALYAGMPGLRYLLMAVQGGCSAPEQIRIKAGEISDEIVMAFTKPLSDEEKNPKTKTVENPSRGIFQGNFREVNKFFYKKGWGDGFPIIPPTEEAVAEMLAGTDLPPDHVVAEIIPRYGKATVEKIAVNAVMAGALPVHMPVLIAGVKAIMEKKAYFAVPEVSTAGYSPMWIMNGPVCGDLNIKSGPGALSPGDISNAAIGRSMGLIIKNIGGARKGLEDLAVFGNPGKWSMVIAEDEEGSPWAPLHVDQGFKKGDSTVTVFFPNSFSTLWPLGKDTKGILEGVIYNVSPSLGNGLFCLMLPERHARTLAENKWSKQQIAKYIAEYARVPAYRHPLYRGGVTVDTEKHRPPLSPDDPIPIWYSPDLIRVVVAGGPGNTMALFYGGFQGGEDHDFVTVKIDLPPNWDKLVEKYRNLVPVYEEY